MDVKTILYICDPEKNTECSKEECHINGGQCRCTEDSRYAKRINNGKLLIALGVDAIQEMD